MTAFAAVTRRAEGLQIGKLEPQMRMGPDRFDVVDDDLPISRPATSTNAAISLQGFVAELFPLQRFIEGGDFALCQSAPQKQFEGKEQKGEKFGQHATASSVNGLRLKDSFIAVLLGGREERIFNPGPVLGIPSTSTRKPPARKRYGAGRGSEITQI